MYNDVLKLAFFCLQNIKEVFIFEIFMQKFKAIFKGINSQRFYCAIMYE